MNFCFSINLVSICLPATITPLPTPNMPPLFLPLPFSACSDLPPSPSPKTRKEQGPTGEENHYAAGRAASPPPGFKIELLHTADPATEGSWICMAKDNKGRLILRPQGQGIFHIASRKWPSGEVFKDSISPLSGAMGALYALMTVCILTLGQRWLWFVSLSGYQEHRPIQQKSRC